MFFIEWDENSTFLSDSRVCMLWRYRMDPNREKRERERENDLRIKRKRNQEVTQIEIQDKL